VCEGTKRIAGAADVPGARPTERPAVGGCQLAIQGRTDERDIKGRALDWFPPCSRPVTGHRELRNRCNITPASKSHWRPGPGGASR